MPSQDDETQRQRRRQDQAYGPPQPGPENRGDHYRYGGETGTVAIDQRLQKLPDQSLDH